MKRQVENNPFVKLANQYEQLYFERMIWELIKGHRFYEWYETHGNGD